MSIDLNKYQRSGVFIEEFDDSVVPPIPVAEAIVNFVPGFSKKGVFNRPVLMTTTDDREAVFGPIDRVLEKKGSFFHRTIDNMVQSGPVWALNLLDVTSDDTLNYVSISTSPMFDNTALLSDEYKNFFNRTGFWLRSTESLIDLADNDDDLLHVTNMGERTISVFVYKDKLTGFDVSLESWYGGRDKVPTYLYPADLASDYMVRFVVLAGDWSDYRTLANDPTWGKYFNANGLRKTETTKFFAERNVTVLLNEVVSLIPYFRDRNNKNLFIESVVNAQTNRTGAYVAFDIDRFETDLPNGKVDLVGHTLAHLKNRPLDPVEKSSVNFLSYSDTIVETDDYSNTALDRLGNVVGVGSVSTRTSANTPGTLSGLTVNESTINANTTDTASVTVTSSSGAAVIGGSSVDVSTQTADTGAISRSATSGESNYRVSVVYLDSLGVLNVLDGAVVSDAAGEADPANVTGLVMPSSYPTSAIVLGYIFSEAPENTGTDISHVYNAVALDGSGFVQLTIGTSNSDIVYDNSTDANTIDITFTATANVTKADYLAWRRKQFFDAIIAAKTTESVIIDVAGVKRAVSGGTWIDNSSVTTADKNIMLTITGSTIKTAVASGAFIFYSSDDEFVIGTQTMVTKNTVATSTEGVVAKYSALYNDYQNGVIKTGDYFYVRVANLTDVRFVSHTDGFDYFIVPTAQVISAFESGFKLWIQGHSVNNGLFTITADGVTSVTGLSLTSETAFKVLENVTTATAEDVTAYSYADKIYLRMYTVGDVLNVGLFSDKSFTAAYTIPGTYSSINTSIETYSDEGAYAQTLEIEVPTGYTLTDTKFLISSTRYPEVVVGNFVDAYVDYDSVEAGEVPRSFTRIISKKPWSGNAAAGTNYMEITTDAKYAYSDYNGDLQTTRYTYFDVYVDTYKAIALQGFKVRAASVPNGTETRLNEILNVMGTGTAMYSAITNKNKFNFRYLVDSFGLGLSESSKQQLADICGGRKNCMGFINMPSLKAFKNSTSPSFVDDEGIVDVSYIRSGGNLDSNPAFLYSFATGEGAPCVGYFTPYVTINDDGRPLDFPPASLAATTYMAKNITNRSGVYRWTIAAGIEDGRVRNIADVEFDFTDDDMIQLEAMGANAIRYADRKGFYIVTEYTASREPLSSLSYLHSREVLIELENELYDMLLPYQWKFNTAAIRAEIKRKADSICQKYVDRDGLYSYRNVIDETNNTNELIDNQFGLLQTYVEIVKGLGTLVNQINIVKTGGIASGSSSGFTTT